VKNPKKKEKNRYSEKEEKQIAGKGNKKKLRKRRGEPARPPFLSRTVGSLNRGSQNKRRKKSYHLLLDA